MSLTSNQIEILRRYQEDTNADAGWLQEKTNLHQRRLIVIPEMQAVLERFQSGQTSLREFKDIFDLKTRSVWDVFGLKGTSGAMFLNMLVNNVPDTELMTREIKLALTVPTISKAQPQMRQFFNLLVDLKKSGKLTGGGIQPNRVPFFLSAWWHVQNPEAWPPYYITARRVYSSIDAFTESADSTADYFRFCELWLQCSQTLGLESWPLESVLAHADVVPRQIVQPPAPTPSPAPIPLKSQDGEPVEETRTHSEIQWMLATIGRQLGCRVWIASNDQSQIVNGKSLGSLSIAELPNLGIGDQPQNLVRLIDVLWLRGPNQIVAAFEVESTTSIYSGLLRMADLNTLCPNLSFPCYIILPANRQAKVCRELARPSFAVLGLPSRCGYLTFEDLRRDYDALMRLATSPEAIRRLATFVKDSEPPAE